MTHEKEKAQYEEDCENHERPWELWEYQDYGCLEWNPCWQEPSWHPYNKYRRKEPPFQPQYYSGLNWRDAPIGKQVEYSDDGGDWSCGGQILATATEPSDDNNHRPFTSLSGLKWYFCRTNPQTYAHPTVTIGDTELPRPETKLPNRGNRYFYINSTRNKVLASSWEGLSAEFEALKNGLVHLTEDRAQAWADWWQNTVMAEVRK